MFRLIIFRILALLGVSVSAALMVDYVRPVPAFCEFRAGCDHVVNSAYGRIVGIPLPVLGLLAFGLFYLLTFSQHATIRKLLGPMAMAAGLAGMSLVLLQKFVLQQICPFCLIADIAAILIAAVELGFLEKQGDAIAGGTTANLDSSRPAARLLTSGLLILCIAAPFVWSAVKPSPEAPEQVKMLQQAESNTIVEITDFGCPHCRAAHAVIEAFRKQHPDLVWKRIVVSMKADSSGQFAAQAWMASEHQGKADAMADELFGLSDITEASCRSAAEKLELDLLQYDADVANSAIQSQLIQTAAWVKTAEAQGLPQLWINNVVVIGEPTEAGLNAAMRRAVFPVQSRNEPYDPGPKTRVTRHAIPGQRCVSRAMRFRAKSPRRAQCDSGPKAHNVKA